MKKSVVCHNTYCWDALTKIVLTLASRCYALGVPSSKYTQKGEIIDLSLPAVITLMVQCSLRAPKSYHLHPIEYPSANQTRHVQSPCCFAAPATNSIACHLFSGVLLVVTLTFFSSLLCRFKDPCHCTKKFLYKLNCPNACIVLHNLHVQRLCRLQVFDICAEQP